MFYEARQDKPSYSAWAHFENSLAFSMLIKCALELTYEQIRIHKLYLSWILNKRNFPSKFSASTQGKK